MNSELVEISRDISVHALNSLLLLFTPQSSSAATSSAYTVISES